MLGDGVSMRLSDVPNFATLVLLEKYKLTTTI